MDREQWTIVGIVTAIVLALGAIFLALRGGGDDEVDADVPETSVVASTTTTEETTETTEAEETTTTEAPTTTEEAAPTTETTEPSPVDPVSLTFAFEADEEGWVAGFADLPTDGQEDFTLDSGWRQLPNDLAGGGFLLTGSNRSDDLHMFMVHKLDNLQPETEYAIKVATEFASNVPSGLAGIGGSPTDSVFLKAGASSVEPTVEEVDGFLRLQIDVGAQSEGGSDAVVVGTLDNPNVDPEAPDPAPFAVTAIDPTDAGSVTSDASGAVWLFFGVDSGFEGVTTIYITTLQVDLSAV